MKGLRKNFIILGGGGLLIILLIVYMHVRNKEEFAPALPPRRTGGATVDLQKAASSKVILCDTSKVPPVGNTFTTDQLNDCRIKQKKNTELSCDLTTGNWMWKCV